MLTLGLVGCGKTKRAGRWSARDLYIGPLFRSSLRYAESHCDVVLILSALHGLVELHQELEDYDSALTQASRPDRERWGESVAAELLRRYDHETLSVTFLAGQGYIDPVVHAMSWQGPHWTAITPLAGLGVGQRLAWLRRAP